MWRTIRRLLDDGCSIVLTTHYLEEAEALADRVVVIAKRPGDRRGHRRRDARARLAQAHQLRIRLAVDDIKRWPGVVDARRDAGVVHVTAFDAESVVRRLLAGDDRLSNLEVKQATLAEAFTELTKEAA